MHGMSYIEDALEEVRRVTPISGVNVCIFDDFEEVGSKLETIANFDTVEEAQDFIDNYDDEEVELVMYEAEESTEYVNVSSKKNHNIGKYVDMAQDDYEKGISRDNDEYENTNYGRTNEKLNKDGTGVRKATRGLNPKKTNAKVLQFVYVSKSECGICREYDGMAFATDSPNRPIIPRLESQGNRGSRPYTHPNCKCKWVRPFSDAGIKNFDDMGLFGGEVEANEIKQKTVDLVRKEYGELKYDKLNREKQLDIIITSLLKKLGAESFDPNSLPIASIIKMTYDAIQPTLALQLARMSHRDSNEVRDIIDDMVGESLSSERKHDIVLEHNLDFSFENLLDLTVTALSETLNEEEDIGMDVELEFTDDEGKAKDSVEDHLEKDPKHYSRLKSVFEEHDVWDEKTNRLVDPSILEDKEEESESWGRNKEPEPEPMSRHDQIKMMRDLGIADKTLRDIGYVLSESNASEWNDRSWAKKPLVCPNCNSIDIEPMTLSFDNSVRGSPYNMCNDCGEKFIEGFESKATEGGRGSGRKGHQKWMLGAEADPEECPNCMIFTEKKNGNCQICGNSY